MIIKLTLCLQFFTRLNKNPGQKAGSGLWPVTWPDPDPNCWPADPLTRDPETRFHLCCAALSMSNAICELHWYNQHVHIDHKTLFLSITLLNFILFFERNIVTIKYIPHLIVARLHYLVKHSRVFRLSHLLTYLLTYLLSWWARKAKNPSHVLIHG